MKVSLKALRINAELRQKEVATAVGVTVKTLQNWERNMTAPTAKQTEILCKLYNCQLSDIFLPDKLA